MKRFLFVFLTMLMLLGVPVSAATTYAPVKLKNGTNYSSYDVSGDGKSDKVKVTYVLEGDAGVEHQYAKIYVNGTLREKFDLFSGGAVYLCKMTSKKVYFAVEAGFYGAITVNFYRYSGGKLINVNGKKYSNRSYFCRSTVKYSTPNYIVLDVRPGTYDYIFKNYSDGFTVQVRLKVTDGKLVPVANFYAKKRAYRALKSFKTGRYATTKDTNGVYVRKGDKVILHGVYFGTRNNEGMGCTLKISVNGKYGWVRDDGMDCYGNSIIHALTIY